MVGEISHRSNPHAGNAEETEMAATGIVVWTIVESNGIP